jgi:hypothetical protein
MSIKFEKPVFHGDVPKVKTSAFTEKKIKGIVGGRAVVSLLQEVVDNKFFKFKKLSDMLKIFVKKEMRMGVCFGEATEILEAVNKFGVKKGLPEKISKTEVLTAQIYGNMMGGLNRVLKLSKEGNKKELKAFAKKVKYVKRDGVDLKKLEKFIDKTKKASEASLKNEHIALNVSKNFSIGDKKNIAKHIKKEIVKNEKLSFLIFLSHPQKSIGHVISAGVNKKPFFFDANRGYARPKSTKKLVELLTQDYFTKESKHVKRYKNVMITTIKRK